MIKKAENLALAAVVGLLVVAGILLAGGVMYKSISFWAGMIAALGQALVVGLAWWGLMLARQQEELRDLPPMGGTNAGAGGGAGIGGGTFRMSYATDAPVSASAGGAGAAGKEPEVRTLETGFQRTVVMLTAVLLVGLAGVIAYFLVYANFAWAKANPDKAFPIADRPLDEMALLIGVGAAALYGALWSITRVRRETAGYGEAVNSNFVLGIGGMVALGGAVVAGYMNVAYAQELAASIIAALLLLQGLELAVNAMRSYARVEELDEPAVDLQALPLVPMLASVWLGGLKLLFAQSMGLSRDGQGGVVGRMMPRVLLALVVIAILVSCIRVVRPGEVAVLERLGSAQGYPDLAAMDAALLQPGLHLTLPWPIDQLVTIPVSRLQTTAVGSELHGTTGGPGGKVDFQFWRFRMSNVQENEEENEFVTGDQSNDRGVIHPSPQMLETFVGIWWRVREPAKFYNSLSHSEFVDKSAGGETRVLPIYEALIQQSAAYAVTKTFAIHTLDDIMTNGRTEVTQHCRKILQEKLDTAESGIEIVDLTIKDVHPPLGTDETDDFREPDGKRRGPANAYENVVSKREFKEQIINLAQAEKVRDVNIAKGEGYTEVGRAKSYKIEQVAKAQGENERLMNMVAGFEDKDASQREFLTGLARQQKLYQALKDVLPNVNKVIVGPDVTPPQIWQVPNNGPMVPGRTP